MARCIIMNFTSITIICVVFVRRSTVLCYHNTSQLCVSQWKITHNLHIWLWFTTERCVLVESLEILDRINKQLSNKGFKNEISLLKQIGLTSSTFSNMRSRNSIPSAENLSKIANALDCSVDYLLGRTDDPSPINKTLAKSESPLHDYFMEKIGRLPNEEELKRLNDFVEVYIQSIKKQ